MKTEIIEYQLCFEEHTYLIFLIFCFKEIYLLNHFLVEWQKICVMGLFRYFVSSKGKRGGCPGSVYFFRQRGGGVMTILT